MLPKVSIVTPSYNQGRFLEQTILSVLNQDYPNIEYIVIDGKSSDESVEIIRKYQDRIFYWVSEPDSGQTEAINKGLRRASGEILCYLNSDDLLDPSAVGLAVREFENNPDAEFVYGDFRLIDPEGVQLLYAKAIRYDRNVLLYGRSLFNQPSSFWRRSVTDKIGLLDESYDFCMDVEYWIRAVANGIRFTYVPGLCAATRIHADAKTSTIVHKLYTQHISALNKNCLLPFRDISFLNQLTFRVLHKLYRTKGVLLRMLENGDFRVGAARKVTREPNR